MSRGRAWTPPVRLAHDHGPISPAIVPASDYSNNHAFSSNPRDHIVLYRPRCTVTNCRQPGMLWSRCRCGQAFSRCHEHEPEHPMAAARAAHVCTLTTGTAP